MRSPGTLRTPAAAGAAAVLLTLGAGMAGAAGAAGTVHSPAIRRGISAGSPITTAHLSGYVASGRRFRYAQAVITVPGRPCGPVLGAAAQPRLYVALAGPRGDARAGLSCRGGLVPRPPTAAGRAAPAAAGRWQAFVSASRPAGGDPATRVFPLGRMRQGGAVFVSVYFSRAAGAVRFFVTGPDGVGHRWSAAAGPGAFYSQAQALADWTGAALPASNWAKPPGARVGWFTSGGFTTAHGRQGTFEGPWTLTRWEATSNSLAPPRGRLVSAPGPLRADGTQRVIGAWGDVFGVWLYP
jgi:hypothetical protein